LPVYGAEDAQGRQEPDDPAERVTVRAGGLGQVIHAARTIQQFRGHSKLRDHVEGLGDLEARQELQHLHSSGKALHVISR
jgi:hypothetical protein